MTAATKSKALEPSLADPLEKRDRKPMPGDRHGSPAQDARVGCGGGGEQSHARMHGLSGLY